MQVTLGGQVLRQVVVLRLLRHCLLRNVSDLVRYASLVCKMHGIEALLLTLTRCVLTEVLILHDLVLTVACKPCSSPYILLTMVLSGGSWIVQPSPPAGCAYGCVHSSTSYLPFMCLGSSIVSTEESHDILLTHTRAPGICSDT